MSAPRKTNEPTMEDILSSIRKMVTDDLETRPESSGGEKNPTAANTKEKRAEERPEKRPDEREKDMNRAGAKTEILELTRMVNDDGTVTDLRQANKAVSAEDAKPEDAGNDPAEVKSGSDTPSKESTGSAAPTAKTEPTGPAAQPDPVAHAPAPAAPASPAPAASEKTEESPQTAWVGHNQTLEALVLEAIEPKIRAWLDANLDRMVRDVLQQKVDVPADQLEKSAREMVRRELKAMLSRLDED